MNIRNIPVTLNFGMDNIGYLVLAEPLTDIQLAQMVLTPAYKQNDDGSLEVIEFSLIPAENAVGLINRGIEHAKE